jgi:hydroxyacylglutathione hydrolase
MTATDFTPLTPELWVLQSDLYATNHGIFISQHEACLIDPGLTEASLDHIAAFVAEQQATVTSLILTHGHWDHLLGRRCFPEAQVFAHNQYHDVIHEHGDDLQRQVTAWDAKRGFDRERPFVPPRPTVTFNTELTLTVGDVRLRLLHAPGHAPDQIVAYHAETGLLWAADMLSDQEIPLVSHSLRAYEHTLANLAALKLRALVPGHGGATTDPADIQRRLEEDRAYLAELRTRVERALAAGASMATTVDACSAMTFRQPEANATAHRWNVESAYVELGGHVDGPVGWDQE